ncbi:MAG: hypothetical protein P8Z36_12755 [Gemmatimonadota bacterium]
MSDPRRPTFSHRFEIGVVHSLRIAVNMLGRWGGDLLGRTLGGMVYRLGIRRSVVMDHLRRAFPDRDERWVRRTAKASYAHLGREAAMMLRLLDAGPDVIRRITRVDGLDEVRAALAQGWRCVASLSMPWRSDRPTRCSRSCCSGAGSAWACA